MDWGVSSGFACTPMPPRTLTRNVVVSGGFSVMVLVYLFHGFCRVGGRIADLLKIDGRGMALQENFAEGKLLGELNCYLCSHSEILRYRS
jgi:hypothetical protein